MDLINMQNQADIYQHEFIKSLYLSPFAGMLFCKTKMSQVVLGVVECTRSTNKDVCIFYNMRCRMYTFNGHSRRMYTFCSTNCRVHVYTFYNSPIKCKGLHSTSLPIKSTVIHSTNFCILYNIMQTNYLWNSQWQSVQLGTLYT